LKDKHMAQLWGGRFAGMQNEAFNDYNRSFHFDIRLLSFDVTASIAYAAELERMNCLTREEHHEMRTALFELLQLSWDPDFLMSIAREAHEDVHSFVEGWLSSKIGALAGKLNMGRSRNDQVATDMRLYVRDALTRIRGELKKVMSQLCVQAESGRDLVMPGYTHLRRAQPVLWAHYLLAYFEMFARDCERLDQLQGRVNMLPLGAGALAGTSYPLDRRRLAAELGFAGVCENSIDATCDRDFVVEIMMASSLIMMHLSKIAEDFIIFSSDEFGFLVLGDEVTSGSSLMPQKKNPDALELMRGKAGRVFGNTMGLLVTLKGLPMGYNKDMQEDKEGLFQTVDTTLASLAMLVVVLETLTLSPEAMRQAAVTGYLNATELADYLAKKGLAFRKAHEITGKIVLHAMAKGVQLEDLSLIDYQTFSAAITRDVYDALALGATLASKQALGGTAPAQVATALSRARQILADLS
jgi:argininosuccinate lyase